MPQARMSPEHADTHFVRACAGDMNVNISPKPLYTEIYRKNAAAQIEPRTQTPTSCEPVQSKRMVKVSQEPPDTEIYRKHAAAQIEPRTQTHILCEPAQSKCMSTCRKKHQKSHFIRKFTGKMPRPRLGPERRHPLHASLFSQNAWSRFHKSHPIRKFTGNMPRPRLSPERRHTFCASLRSRNACQDFTRATWYGNLQEKCRAPDWARNADTHFVRACAVEMHVHMPQETSEEPLYREIYRKNAAAQMGPEGRHTFCAILRSRNACQDFTRATWYGNLQEKCRSPEWAPWSSTGLYSYRKNPSVWTHCLGKKICCLLGLKVENVWSDEMSERPDWNNPAISRKSPSWIKPFSNPPALKMPAVFLCARVNRKQLRTLQALTWGSGVHFSLESCWFFMVLKRS